MRKQSLAICLLAMLVACQQMPTESNPLDYDEIDVCFKASLTGAEWPEGATVGIVATCVRDGEEGTVMSGSKVARFKTGGEYLVPVSENDRVIARRGDHGFKFIAIYPCPDANADLAAIPVAVPATQDGRSDISTRLVSIGSTVALTVLPPVEINLSSPFSILTFEIPSDELTGTSFSIKKVNVSLESGSLVQSGTYNAFTGKFTETGTSGEVTVDFGEGISLGSSSAIVQFLTAPFTVPEGGVEVNIIEGDNTETTLSAFSGDKDKGMQIKEGGTYSTVLTGDGIVPVKFPVIFPLGYKSDNTAYYTSTDPAPYWVDWVQDEAFRKTGTWTGQHGKILCPDQPQAYFTWNWDEKISQLGIVYKLDAVANANAGIRMNSPWPVGMWTDDFFEFVIPVRKFAAGSIMKLTIPFFTRKGPTFWEVLYLDGDEWKSTAQDDLPALPGSDIKARATWAVPYHEVKDVWDNNFSVRMTFANAIPSGEIHIKVRVVDGSIISFAANTVTTGNTTPNVSGTTANAPWYLADCSDTEKVRADQAIRIEM